jgi:hypothetical protein
VTLPQRGPAPLRADLREAEFLIDAVRVDVHEYLPEKFVGELHVDDGLSF